MNLPGRMDDSQCTMEIRSICQGSYCPFVSSCPFVSLIPIDIAESIGLDVVDDIIAVPAAAVIDSLIQTIGSRLDEPRISESYSSHTCGRKMRSHIPRYPSIRKSICRPSKLMSVLLLDIDIEALKIRRKRLSNPSYMPARVVA